MPVLLAAAAFLLVGLDASVNIAFPAMSAAFGVGPTTIRWVIICYVGTYALTAFAAGLLADRLGPGRVVRAGFVLSLLCFAGYALAPSFAALLALRVWQGASGGLLYGAAPALVTLSLPASRHGWGLGWASAGLGLGLSVSPLIGGALVGVFGWQAAFVFRVPVAALFVVLAAWTVAPHAGGHGLARMVAPTDILRWRVLHPGLLAFLANFAQFSVWLLAPYYLVTQRGLTATTGGLLFTLTPLATAVAAPIAGRITDRWGARGPIVAGLVAESVGLLLVGRCGAATPFPLVGAALALVGLGLGMFQVPNLAQAMAAFPAGQQGAAGGFAFLSRTIGVVAGVQSAAWLFGARAPVLGFLPAFRFAFDAAAAVCALAALLSLAPSAKDDAEPRRSRRQA
ncbi:MAG TPA: MFS transporter [Candidatus Bathyarchaeia archaeon]|nr:MFS transporter [Candidatus Bathyarchaeia archaeon]